MEAHSVHLPYCSKATAALCSQFLLLDSPSLSKRSLLRPFHLFFPLLFHSLVLTANGASSPSGKLLWLCIPCSFFWWASITRVSPALLFSNIYPLQEMIMLHKLYSIPYYSLVVGKCWDDFWLKDLQPFLYNAIFQKNFLESLSFTVIFFVNL